MTEHYGLLYQRLSRNLNILYIINPNSDNNNNSKHEMCGHLKSSKEEHPHTRLHNHWKSHRSLR